MQVARSLFLPLLLAPAVLAAGACQGGSSSPSQPQAATVQFVYQSVVEPGPPNGQVWSAGCSKHVLRNHLVPRWDAGRRVELGPQLDDFYTAAVADVPVGRQVAVTAFDVAQCAHPTFPWGVVTRRLTANGVELTRVIEVSVSGTSETYPSLAFTVLADGTVVP